MSEKTIGKDKIAEHLQLGKTGENVAAFFLERNGIRIIDRNWRHGHLELDLIGEQEGQIIFVEVKTRGAKGFGGPEGAITAQKRKKLIKAAQAWLAAKQKWHYPCRFDVLCLVKSRDNFTLEHYPNAFDLSTPVGYRHSYWQY